MPLAAMTLPLTIYLPAFYATTIGINLAIVGIIFSVVRLADLIFDPLVGGLIDRTHGRCGPYRPWLIAGAPVIMVGAWMLFMAKPGATPLYLALALIVTYCGYSIITLAQMGFSTSITTEYSERSRVFAWWQIFNMAGILLVLLEPWGLNHFHLKSNVSYETAMGWLVVSLVPITICLTVFTVRGGASERPLQTVHFADFFDLLKLRSARLLLASVMMTGLALGITSAVFVFFFTTVKGIGSDTYTALLLIGFTVSICASPVWAWLGSRIGKHRALAAGCLGSAVFFILTIFMSPRNPGYMFGIFVLNGFVNCSADILPRAMMADVCDEDGLLSNRNRTAMLFALLGITIKMGQAIAIGMVYVALYLIGFKAVAGGANTRDSLIGVTVLYAVVPALLQGCAALFIWRYPLTAHVHNLIRERLDQEKLMIPPDDPLLAGGTLAGMTPGWVTIETKMDS